MVLVEAVFDSLFCIIVWYDGLKLHTLWHIAEIRGPSTTLNLCIEVNNWTGENCYMSNFLNLNDSHKKRQDFAFIRNTSN